MNKFFLSFVACSSLLASNYKLVNLSSDGIALSGSNLAKSFSADAAYYNPANMAFLGDRPQFHSSLNYYNISGSRYKNTLTTTPSGEPYLNAEDTHGKEFTFILPTLGVVYPINERHYVGLAGYTDFAAVYGWNGNYAKALTDTMDIRGGTLAISYAYKFSDELSFGASLKANYAKLKYSLIKDNVENPRYVAVDGREPSIKDFNYHGRVQDVYKSYVYSGSAKGKTGVKFGYSASLTYVPNYFDNNLRFSLLYNSSHNNHFKGNLRFEMSKFGIHDFIGTLFTGSHNIYDFNDQSNMQTLLGLAIGYTSIINQTGSAQIGIPPTKRQDETVKFDGPMSVNMLYPANLNFGMAYTYGKHDFMFNIGRTFWKKAKELSININESEMPDKLKELAFRLGEICKTGACFSIKNGKPEIDIMKVIAASSQLTRNLSEEENKVIQEYLMSQIVKQSFDQGYKDTTLISLGYRYNYNDNLSFMLGFATEDSPVRRQKISFLAKDSRLYMYSAGVEYRLDKQLKLNLSGAYQRYADVEIHDVDNVLLWSSGRFSHQSNQIINLGLNYEF